MGFVGFMGLMGFMGFVGVMGLMVFMGVMGGVDFGIFFKNQFIINH